MGLDMYLWGNASVHAQNFNRETRELETNPRYTEMVDSLELTEDEHLGDGWIRIQIPVMVWRKANAIHGWFVDHCQGGVDDCRDASVSQEDLQKLLDEIKECLETKDTKGLEPRRGFFFGNYEIDEYYWQDLEDTLETLEPLLKRYEYFTYSSSW